jgi:hypothetical protein
LFQLGKSPGEEVSKAEVGEQHPEGADQGYKSLFERLGGAAFHSDLWLSLAGQNKSRLQAGNPRNGKPPRPSPCPTSSHYLEMDEGTP